MNTRARDILAAARIRVVQKHPYLASALFSLRPCETPGLGTMAVNAKWVLLYDPEKVIEWGSVGTAAILVHEVQHLLRDHPARYDQWVVNAQAEAVLSSITGAPAEVTRERLHLLFNIAGDAEINDDVIAAGWKLPENTAKGEQMVLPSRLGLPERLTAEEYADVLLKRARPQPDGPQGKTPGCGGSCGIGHGDQLNEMLPPDAPTGMDTVEQGLVKVQTAHEIQEHVKANGRGSVPLGLSAWAEKQLAPPVVDWRKQLRTQVRSAVAAAAGADDYTYRTRSRREPVTRLALGRSAPILPGLHRPVPTIKVVLDTSGSMSGGPLEAALSEVLGIAKSTGVGVDVLMVDAAVHVTKKVQRLADLNRDSVLGGGGTDMRVGIAAAAEDGKAHVIVVLTDGYTPWPSASEMPRARLVVGIVTDEAVPDHIRHVVRVKKEGRDDGQA